MQVERPIHIRAELVLDSPVRVGAGSGNLDRIYFPERYSLLRGTLIEVVLPFDRILNSVAREIGGLAGSGLIAELNELFDARIVGHPESFHVDANLRVRRCEGTALVLSDHDFFFYDTATTERVQLGYVAWRKPQ